MARPTIAAAQAVAIADAAGTDSSAPAAADESPALLAAAARQVPAPVVFEYSDAYQTRAKIHRIASFTTLPLFGAEAFVGESLYRDPNSSGKRTAHLALATAIGGLFGLNTVTGVWNLVAARKDPNGRARRWVHGTLMLAADAGFLATALSGPHDHRGVIRGSPSTHRAIAFASISLATSGYLVMVIDR